MWHRKEKVMYKSCLDTVDIYIYAYLKLKYLCIYNHTLYLWKSVFILLIFVIVLSQPLKLLSFTWDVNICLILEPRWMNKHLYILVYVNFNQTYLSYFKCSFFISSSVFRGISMILYPFNHFFHRNWDSEIKLTGWNLGLCTSM